MAYQPKTWSQKMHISREPVIKRLDKNVADMRAGEQMLIATPLVVDDYIRQIPAGTTTTLLQMRKDLAAAYGADTTCPLTSGIFLRIVAEAAFEAYEAGTPLDVVTPFWRLLDPASKAAAKLSFDPSFIVQQRQKEKRAMQHKK